MQRLCRRYVHSNPVDRPSKQVRQQRRNLRQGLIGTGVTCWAPPKPRTAPRSFSCCISRSAAASASGPFLSYAQPSELIRAERHLLSRSGCTLPLECAHSACSRPRSKIPTWQAGPASVAPDCCGMLNKRCELSRQQALGPTKRQMISCVQGAHQKCVQLLQRGLQPRLRGGSAAGNAAALRLRSGALGRQPLPPSVCLQGLRISDDSPSLAPDKAGDGNAVPKQLS